MPIDREGTFSLYTLGCKLNQLEGEAIADSFIKAGFSLVRPGVTHRPGIIIINTCTVTSKADQKCRRAIRKSLRENPDSCVIVTGCYAHLDPGEIALLEHDGGAGFGRLFVAVGGEPGCGTGTAKSALLDLPEYAREAIARSPDASMPEIIERWMGAARGGGPFEYKPEGFSLHSRGFLKIQDGCDNSCNYCRARLARGPCVSLPKEEALARLRSHEEQGCAELMVTGVNITQYRHSGLDLAGLLEYLLEGSSAIALRLSSLEPEAVNEKLASALSSPRIRPHFHLSVQSGSDAVLRSMGRAYTSQAVEKAASLLRSVKDNPFLACDIIAGFPGEGTAEFDQTLALCAKIGFAWIHAFPYSKRPGTMAFTLDKPVCEREITQRVETLLRLAQKGRADYAQAWLGRELSAVVEKSPPAGQYRAVSENYLKLLVHSPDKLNPGDSLRCIPLSLCGGPDGEKPDAVAALVST